jgi:hypothetical protein
MKTNEITKAALRELSDDEVQDVHHALHREFADAGDDETRERAAGAHRCVVAALKRRTLPHDAAAIDDVAKSFFERLFSTKSKTVPRADSDARVEVVILGTNTLQKPTALGESFGLLVKSKDAVVLVDPGPDVDRQVLRHVGDAALLDAVVLTHDNPHVRKGLLELEAMGFAGDVHAEHLDTVGVGVVKFLGDVRWKFLRVKHETGVPTVAVVVSHPEAAKQLVLAPHVRDVTKLASEFAESEGARLALVGAGHVDGSDREYSGLSEFENVDFPAVVVAAQNLDEWREVQKRLPTNVEVLQAGTSVVLSVDDVAVYDENTPQQSSKILEGYVSATKSGDGAVRVYVREGIRVGDEIRDCVLGYFAPEVRETVALEFVDELPDDCLPIFDLTLTLSTGRQRPRREPPSGDSVENEQ